MKSKQKTHVTPDTVVHSLFGLGLGVLLTALIPSLSALWIGIVLMAIALVSHKMGKA